MSGERGCSPASVALAFLVGGALGASLALLFAPEGGRQTRTRLKDLATDVRDCSTDFVDDVRDRVEDVIGVGREVFEEKKAILTAAYQAGKEAMERERGKTQER